MILFLNIFAQNKFYGRVGLALSYLPSIGFSDLSSTNDLISIEGFPKIENKFYYCNTIAGYFYTMFIPNVRIGGIYSFGSSKSEKEDIEIYYSKFDNVFGGLSLEYSFSVGSVNISCGSIIGGGNEELSIGSITQNLNWEEIFINNNSKKFTSLVITQNYFSLVPTLNFEYSLSRFIAFRIGGGYLIKIAGKPKIENIEIQGFSERISKNNFYLNAGFLIGFFSR